MSDAWMKRGAERQELLELLKRLIIKQEDKVHDSQVARHATNTVLMEHLALKSGVALIFMSTTSEVTVARRNMQQLFQDMILPQIKDFAKAEEEENALIAELYTWSSVSIAAHFKGALMTAEIREPETFFDGKQATDPVD